jgi:hypothetical protein
VFALATVAVLAGAMIVPRLVGTDQKTRQASNLAKCQENLRRAGVGFLAYLQDYQSLPVSGAMIGPHVAMVQAVGGRYVPDFHFFYCPAEEPAEASTPALETRWSKGDIGYFYYSAQTSGGDERLSKFLLVDSLWPRRLTKDMPADTWVMSDQWFSAVPTAHQEYKKGVNYLTLDGGVDFVSESIRTVFK